MRFRIENPEALVGPKGDPGNPGPPGIIHNGAGSSSIDFGNTPSMETSVDVAGQGDISATSRVRVWLQRDTMGSNSADDHQLASESIVLTTSAPVAGVGFTIYASSNFALWTKRFRVEWHWLN